MIAYTKLSNTIMALCLIMVLVLLSACHERHDEKVDQLNDLAYANHYRNLDSVEYYAAVALQMAGRYDGGRAEALNNQAFVSIAKMRYPLAYRQLDSLVSITDNQVELLIADVQYMRLCQRESKNKDFYTYKENASEKIKRIKEGYDELSEHLRRRFLYGLSEFYIVTSTYYYYVGLEEQSVAALREIDKGLDIEADTAQYLNYLYNIGAGGIINEGNQDEINQVEFDHLMRCYLLSVQGNYPFWTANALQAMSEHLQSDPATLIDDNLPAMKYINTDEMPDSLLAGNLAQRSLDLFRHFGDVYQIAGAYRTLAQCYWGIEDYQSSLICLQEALSKDTLIHQAPDLVASIREQLSVVYAAMNDKQNSDINRNFYLDKQEQTRQDRYLESRADQLDKAVSQTNMLIIAVVIVILLTILSFAAFILLRRKKGRGQALEELALPLEEWRKDNEQAFSALDERVEEIAEQQTMATLLVKKSKKENLEQRAKISLVNSIMPFIDRMLLEIDRIVADNGQDDDETERRYEYIGELTEKINEYNEVLTQWIQLRQGEIKLHIESFPLQKLFDIIERGRMGFALKDIRLDVEPTDQAVKADRILTLFMINTMADNARKFTGKGGTVSIFAEATEQYVEVSVQDNGVGMDQEEAEGLFDTNKHHDVPNTAVGVMSNQEKGHGFGLLNCKGIIEKYKKISSIFNVCDIGVQSEKGKGSRFFFRLPKGIVRVVVAGIMALGAFQPVHAQQSTTHVDLHLMVSDAYADSAYSANIKGDYRATLRFSDTIRVHMNAYYLQLHPEGNDTLRAFGATSVVQPEVIWLHDNIPVDYGVILSMRNESAVAALALHEWALYKYNNKVYTQLFKEISADHTLEDYCRVMQASKASKDVAVILLILLFVLIVLAYFILYYRHQVYYRFCLEKVKGINDILLSEHDDSEKQGLISKVLNDGSADSLPHNLQQIVSQIQTALDKSVSMKKNRLTDIHLAEDELHRSEYEHEKLYVCNSVLDNCLSTLKHETMYYPSRIQRLMADKDRNMDMVQEMAHYYKELYTLLSMQAMRQLESIKPVCKVVALSSFHDIILHEGHNCRLLCDADMLAYLFEILRKQNNGRKTVISKVIRKEGSRYADIFVGMEQCNMSDEECQGLFFPAARHLPFLLCRQIVRDIGETTNARGCGIKAARSVGGTGIDIHLTLALASQGRDQ